MAAYAPEMVLPATSAAVTGSSSIASMAVVGHLEGSLNDVMYGLVATDTDALQLRLRCMVDPEVLETAMISCIELPSDTDPFNFVGVQRVVRGEASRMKSKSRRPREFVLLVASGIVWHQGQEIGYYLCQSVEMQACKPCHLPRGWLSTCSLFTLADERSAQTDVFSRGYVDFKGKMQDYQATKMMSSLMLAGVTEAPSCGRSKKLSWLLNTNGAAEEFRRKLPEANSASTSCGICERKFGVLHSVSSCVLCEVKICSRCCVSRDLGFVDRQDVDRSRIHRASWDEGHQGSGQVRCQTVLLCKKCKMNTCHMDASVMARREVEAGHGRMRAASIGDAVNSSRMSLSCSRSESNRSWIGEGIAQSCLWTPGTNAAKLRRTTLSCKPRDDQLEVVQTHVALNRMDSGNSCSSDSTTYNYSFASTLSSQQDRGSSQEEFSIDLIRETYLSRPQYIESPKETDACSHEANVNAGQYDFMRRLQELQKNAESVYQYTSTMSAKTCCQNEEFVTPYSGVSISELD